VLHASRHSCTLNPPHPPFKNTEALTNFADPPAATAPAPSYAWTYSRIGLENREYRDRPSAASKGTAAAAGAASLTAAAAAAVKQAAASSTLPGRHRRRRRKLHGTAYSNGGNSGASTTARPTSAGGSSSTATFSGLTTGLGISRPIGGGSIGFDGIGAPETRLIPEDLSLAVGTNAAIHTANSLIRFYRVDVAGKKAKGRSEDPADSSSFLKQVWTADFFYAVRLALLAVVLIGAGWLLGAVM